MAPRGHPGADFGAHSPQPSVWYRWGLIMKGTPYPDGDPGHSCVIVADSGESKGAACRTR
jgi:hypothetical protein